MNHFTASIFGRLLGATVLRFSGRDGCGFTQKTSNFKTAFSTRTLTV